MRQVASNGRINDPVDGRGPRRALPELTARGGSVVDGRVIQDDLPVVRSVADQYVSNCNRNHSGLIMLIKTDRTTMSNKFQIVVIHEVTEYMGIIRG